MNKESILFIIITYFLTLLTISILPSSALYYCLTALMPVLVTILLTIYNKQKISSLFKRDSAKNLMYGIIIPLVTVPSIFGLSWLFSLVEYTTKNVEAMNIDNKAFILTISLVSSYVGSIAGSVVSEISWRGYLLKNMKSQISSFYVRALLISLVYGIWSTIMYTFNPFLSTYKEYISLSVICITFVQIFLGSIIYSWLFERNDSIWPGVLASSLFYTLLASFGFFIELKSLFSVGFLLLSTAFYFLTVVCILLLDRCMISNGIRKLHFK